MRKCMINWVSLGFVGLGCFLLGGATGLALSKDEEDIWAEDAVRLGDIIDEDGANTYATSGYITPVDVHYDEVATESYERMVHSLYGDITPEQQELLKNDVDHIVDDEEDLDNAIDATIKEIEVEGDVVQIKETSEGVVEVGDPYIISEEEFFDDSVFPEFERETLIYYEEDDVLTTERDEVIYEVEETVGLDALSKFGELSSDDDTVYIRNVRFSLEYEVVRNKGSYTKEVLGYSDDDEIDYKKAKQFFNKLDEEREE